MPIKAHLDYTPRDPFIPFHRRNTRWAWLCCHRRAGKTVACVNDLVLRALYTKKKRAKYAYVGPFRQQTKEIAWEYVKAATEPFRKGVPRESDLKVTLPNDATIQLYGADNAEALRGLYFDGVILDEYADYRPSVWGEIILPTLMDRKGWAAFVGTMKGKNHFWQQGERAKKDGWFHMVLKASESGLLSPEDLAEMQLQMTEGQYRQEMECDPNAAVQGTFYSDLIAKIQDKGRIGNYPPDPNKDVYVACDLGYSDSTAFWFWQMDDRGPRIIDYEEDDGKALSHYFEMLNQKGYHYEKIWLPHDAKARTLQTGRSTVEQFLDQGFPVDVVPRLAVQHGIDAARMMIPRCRFNAESCYTGIEALRAYRRQFNEKTQQYSNTPLHDWASNGADAFRMFSLVTDARETQEEKTVLSTIMKPPEYTLDQLWEDREADQWRNRIIRL